MSFAVRTRAASWGGRYGWLPFALWLIGCSNSQSPTAGPSTHDAGDVTVEPALDQCGIESSADECTGCLVDNCCEELTYCSQRDACRELGACVDACGSDADCASDCSLAYATGLVPRQAVLDCKAHACSGPCDLPEVVCGVVAEPGECSDCTIASCCHELEACAANPACDVIGACLEDCAADDLDCALACRQSYPDGYAAWRAKVACESHLCTEPCAIPSELACGKPLPDAACNACAVTACCEEMVDARTNASVAALELCVDTCAGDADCNSNCIVAEPEGFARKAVLDNCLFIQCGDACEPMLEERFPCGSLIAGATPDCRACVEEKACDGFREAAMSAAYWEFVVCVTACGSSSSCASECCYDNLEGCGFYYAKGAYQGAECLDECSSGVGYLSPCGAFDYYPCNDCVESSCCEEAKNASSPQGAAYLMCILACEDASSPEACRSQCVADFPDGAVYYDQVTTCEGTICSAECGFTARPCGLRWGHIDACADCLIDNCCEQSTECAASFDCARIDMCRHLERCSPEDTACIDTCRSGNPDGVGLFDALETCRSTSCSLDCEGS